jgi:hypothetical protein
MIVRMWSSGWASSGRASAVAVLAAVWCAAVPGGSLAQTTPPQTLRVVGQATGVKRVSTVLVAVTASGAVDAIALAAAVRATGVTDIVLFRGRRVAPDLAPVTVRGRLVDADEAKLNAVVDAARAFAERYRATTSRVDTNFYGLAADCPAAEQLARAEALVDARRLANEIATSQHLRAGERLAAQQRGGCPAAGPFGGVTAFDPATVSIRITVSEVATFAVAP